MKYVMFKKKLKTMTIFHPVIFPNHLVHADVANAMLFKGAPLDGFKAVSAGEVSFYDGEPVCHGESVTLGLKAHSKDSKIIKMNDYGGGLL